MSEVKDAQQHPKVEISVENFGPIAKANIDLRPLTVFVGPSNTGKTCFATIVYTLYDIFQEFAYLAKQKHSPDFNISEAELETTEAAFKRTFDVASVLDLIRLPNSTYGHFEISIKVSQAPQKDLPFSFRGESSERISLGRNPFAELTLYPRPQIDSERCYYLPATRSGILQSHRIIASSLVKHATGVRSEQLPEIPTLSGLIADFMQEIILYDEQKNPNAEMKHLAEMLETEVLAGQIRLKPSASGYPNFSYLPQGMKEEIRISQTSSMVSELAPLVLYLRGLVRPGDTLIIEEPEAHLHPGAQADIAVILARLVRAGVKVIITTHSDWMLQEIGNLIRVGELEKIGEKVSDLPASLQKEQVGVWHFQKDGKVEEIPYNRIDGVEPMEYLDVAEDLYNRSARLQNRLEETKGNSERE